MSENREIKIKVVSSQIEKCWEGDGMRPGDNIRSGKFWASFVSPDDAKLLSRAITWPEAEEQVTGVDRGTYSCQVLEACEDGFEPALELDEKISSYLRKTLTKIVFVGGEKVSTPPKGWIEVEEKKLYLGEVEKNRFKTEVEKFIKQ